MKPISPGVLGFLTEVHIQPNLEYIEKPETFQGNKMEKIKGFQFIYEKINIFPNRVIHKENDLLDTFLDYKHDLVYRIVPISSIPSYIKMEKYFKPYNVFISKKNLSSQCFNEDSRILAVYCSLSRITEDVFSNNIVYNRLLALEDFFSEIGAEYINCVFVSDNVFSHFNCYLGEKVILKFINEVPCVNGISIHTKKKYLIDAKEEFENYLSSHNGTKLVLNSDFPLVLGHRIICNLKFTPPDSKFAVIDKESLRNLKINVIEEEVVLPEKTESKMNELKSNAIWEKNCYLRDIIEIVLQNLQSDFKQFENVLIIGKCFCVVD